MLGIFKYVYIYIYINILKYNLGILSFIQGSAEVAAPAARRPAEPSHNDRTNTIYIYIYIHIYL